MKSNEPDLNLLSELNSISLKTSELMRVIKATMKMHKNDHPRPSLGTISIVKDFGWSSNKAAAIVIRLQALAKMAEKNELRNWIVADETAYSSTIAYKAIIAATAKHPPTLVDGDSAFEKEPFLHRVLELAEPEGNPH